MELTDIGVTTRQKNILNERGISSVEDILALLPKSYSDFRKPTGFLPSSVDSCVIARLNRVIYGDCVIAMLSEASTGASVCVKWFNAGYMYDTVNALMTRDILIAGKAAYNSQFKSWDFVNPAIFTSKINENLKIYPRYKKIQGIANDKLIAYIGSALHTSAAEMETLPGDVVAQYGLASMADTYRFLHAPQNMNEVNTGKNRMLFNDLLDFSLRNEYAARQNCIGSQFNIRSMDLYNAVNATIPFQPTTDQTKAVNEIIATAKAGKRINALLCGDVGTGKTYVAQMAAALFAGSGYQVAVLAPTQILARQHYEDFKAMFEPHGIKVVFAERLPRKADREALAKSISSGEAKIIIGTHSVFSDSIKYKNLALTIADEEHRFGVCQRASLIAKASTGVHTISMSATPIPRSLATVMYGDMVKLMTIETRPAGRLPVITGIAKSRDSIYRFLESEIRNGRQAYIVCPMIDKNEKLEGVKSVEEIYEEYSKRFKGTGIVIETLTGQTKKEELEQIIGRFKNNETQILISTTVVEVGVNVPNASVMVITNAERFGLAGLHQLRGRVGRGKYQSYCVLESTAKTGTARQRLEALCRTDNGFKIAEYDLQFRGAGEMLGTQQSGKNKYLSLALAYPNEYKTAREAASMLLDRGISCCDATRRILTENLTEIGEIE